MPDKPLPADINAEAAALGSMLMDRDAVIAVAAWLEPSHFYLEKHRHVYAAILACHARREPPDLTNVASELRARQQLAVIGDIAALADLASSVSTAYHVEYYSRTVARTARLRALIQAGGAIAALGYDEQTPEDEVVAAAFARLTAATSRQHQGGIVTMQQAVNAAWSALEA
jgi:replicative DNA helicase